MAFTQNARLTSHPLVHPLWHEAAYKIKDAGSEQEMQGGGRGSSPFARSSSRLTKTLISRVWIRHIHTLTDKKKSLHTHMQGRAGAVRSDLWHLGYQHDYLCQEQKGAHWWCSNLCRHACISRQENRQISDNSSNSLGYLDLIIQLLLDSWEKWQQQAVMEDDCDGERAREAGGREKERDRQRRRKREEKGRKERTIRAHCLFCSALKKREEKRFPSETESQR